MAQASFVETISAPQAELRWIIPGKNRDVFLALMLQGCNFNATGRIQANEAEDARRNKASMATFWKTLKHIAQFLMREPLD